MNIFSESYIKKKYFGNYRAKIVEIDTTNKNGIYKIKVYPMMFDIEDQYLPLAFSNLTNKNENENLAVDDWVWVFFEGGNCLYPIIFDKCNIKDSFPAGADGTSPDWFSDITANTDIDETTVTFAGQYGTVYTKDYGDNIHVLFDEENQVFVLKMDNYWLLIDTDGNIHSKMASSFLTVDQAYNIGADTIKILAGQNEITADNQGVIINSNLKILNT